MQSSGCCTDASVLPHDCNVDIMRISHIKPCVYTKHTAHPNIGDPVKFAALNLVTHPEAVPFRTNPECQTILKRSSPMDIHSANKNLERGVEADCSTRTGLSPKTTFVIWPCSWPSGPKRTTCMGGWTSKKPVPSSVMRTAPASSGKCESIGSHHCTKTMSF